MDMHQERNFLHLFLFLVFASTLGWYINSYPPELLWQFGVFYLLFGIAILSLTHFILCNIRRSILITTGIILFLILRSFNLRHPLYVFLLLACLVSVEYSATRTRKMRGPHS